MPVGRNSVYGPAHAPVYDPAPIHGKRRVYVTGGAFDLPPFHQAGFVTQFGILALSVGYPAPVDLVLTSATVTLRATGGGSVTFVINVNGVPTESRTVFTAGLTVYPLDVLLAPGDVVTSQVTDTTGSPEDFLVVLRAEVIECPIYSWVYIVNSAPTDGQIIPNLGTAPDADLVVNNLGADDWTLGSTDGRTPVGAVCDPALPWTALIRVGDFAASYATITGPTDGRAISGEWITPDGANNELWTFGQSTGGGDGLTLFEVISGLATSGALSPASPISDITFMISATPPAVGGTVSDYRAVTIEGPVADHVITDLSLTGELYSPGAGIVPFIQLTNVPFSQGVNGLGLWRERCTTDAEFLAKYADFAPPATPTFRSSTSILANLTATLTPPAGVQTGDLLVLCAMRRTTHTVSTNDPFISSTGGQSWLEVGQNFNSGYSCRVWSAIAAGTLTNVVIAGTETFSSQATCNAALLVFKAGTFDPHRPGGTGPYGVQLTSPVSGFSPLNVGTMSPIGGSLRLVVGGARRNGVSGYGPMTIDTGWTIRAALNAATGLANNSGLVVGEKATPVGGLTSGTDVITEGGGNFIQAFHLAIYPP